MAQPEDRQEGMQHIDRKQILEQVERSYDGYGLIPESVEERTYQLLESNQNIDEEILDYALDQAAEYWREHVHEEADIFQRNGGFGVRCNEDLDEEYVRQLASDLHSMYSEQLETEDISQLALHLKEIPEDDKQPVNLENVPHNRDPKWTSENEDYPSMFQ